jgi:nucleoside-diphosphate-sugar epimerase
VAHIQPADTPPERYFAVNAAGTGNMARAAAEFGVQRFIHVSSVAVYGDYDLPIPVRENSLLRASGAYAESKLAAENIVQEASAGGSLWIMRMATMYSRDWLFNIRKRVAPPGIGRLCRIVFEQDRARFSLCSLEVGVKAIACAVEGRLPTGTYNVADEKTYSQRDILRLVEARDGWRPVLRVPKPVARTLRYLTRGSESAPPSRARSYGLYWKYFETTLYATDRLRQHGFGDPPSAGS